MRIKQAVLPNIVITARLCGSLLFSALPLFSQEISSRTENVGSISIQKAVTKLWPDTLGCGLTGRVYDEKKEPMINVVILLSVDGTLKGSVTDYDGVYSFGSLQPGLYKAVILYLGYDSLIQDSIIVAPFLTLVRNFQMKRSAQKPYHYRPPYRTSLINTSFTGIAGRITDNKRTPLPGVKINSYENGTRDGWAITDRDGSYYLTQRPGSREILFSYPGYDSVLITGLTIVEDSTKNIDLKLSKSRTRCLSYETFTIFCPPIIDIDYPTRRIFKREEIDQLPLR